MTVVRPHFHEVAVLSPRHPQRLLRLQSSAVVVLVTVRNLTIVTRASVGRPAAAAVALEVWAFLTLLQPHRCLLEDSGRLHPHKNVSFYQE